MDGWYWLMAAAMAAVGIALAFVPRDRSAAASGAVGRIGAPGWLAARFSILVGFGLCLWGLTSRVDNWWLAMSYAIVPGLLVVAVRSARQHRNGETSDDAASSGDSTD